MGRPTTYTKDLAEEICSRIADGKSLRAICTAKDMPARSSVFKWLNEEDGFSDQYEAAVLERAHFRAEEALEIVDGAALNPQNVQAARLRVDTRKWFASKLAPKKYGDKLAVGGEGEDSRPLVVTWANGEKL